MGEESWIDCPVIDGHVHYGHPSLMPDLMDVFDQYQIDRLNIVCTPHMERLSLVPDAIHLKAHFPNRIYVFGGLDISVFFRAPLQAGQMLADYVDLLMAMGCDGIKMIEGKPTIRQMLPINGFDADVLDPYWKHLEKRGVPVVFHVNDPEEFWDEEKLPDWAKEAGWFYGDGSFVNNEAQYQEVLNVLEKHPNLKIIFAHFFFLSAQLPRLAEYLDRFPNMHVDLTPGIEMYRNFSENIQQTRDFFIKYQDRIIFGTDIGANSVVKEDDIQIDKVDSRARVHVIRNFLELDRPFSLDGKSGFLFGKEDKDFCGIGLQREILEKIYYKNFEELVGTKPRLLNKEVILQAFYQLSEMIKIQGSAQPGVPGDPSVVEQVKAYFEGKGDAF
ncbi:MAG: amidohydrolase family protein [Anaerolineaceae bacterium]|nr:amidohydrolase family protein [Anaerolineaceae bacterium]